MKVAIFTESDAAASHDFNDWEVLAAKSGSTA